MSGSAVVPSYASRGLRLWATFNSRHGRDCPCLICADTRVFLERAPLIPSITSAQQAAERRAS